MTSMSENNKKLSKRSKGISVHPLIYQKVEEAALSEHRSFSNMVELILAKHFEIDLTKPMSELLVS